MYKNTIMKDEPDVYMRTCRDYVIRIVDAFSFYE